MILDHFFVQGWLRDPLPPEAHFDQPPPPPFPREDYSNLFISQLHQAPDVETLDDFHPPVLGTAPYEGDVSPLDEIRASEDPHYYAKTFTRLLSQRLHYEADLTSCITIYHAPIWIFDHSTQVYAIEIPTVREDSPRLAEGDSIFLRGVHLAKQWVSPWEVQAEIVSIQKARGMVYIRGDTLYNAMAQTPMWKIIAGPVEQKCFRIRFVTNPQSIAHQGDALRRCAIAMQRDEGAMKRWLFPEPRHVEEYIDEEKKMREELELFNLNGRHEGIGPPVGKEDEGKKRAVKIGYMDWHDKGLNNEQKVRLPHTLNCGGSSGQTAITGLVNCHHRIPYLISGPPGTGKTRTLAEAVVQILCQDICHNVLVCAPTNTAADTIARRILSQVEDSTSIFRLNHPSRPLAEVRADLHRICFFNSDATRFDMPPYESLMSFRVVVCSLQDSMWLKYACADNTTIMHAQYVSTMIFNPRRDPNELEILPHWTHLVIDEAAQASEPELLVPLSIVNPYRHETISFDTWDPTVVLCGDQNQWELDISLFERLYEREVYARARQDLPAPWVHTAATQPFTALVRNYRSMEQILMFTGSIFYNDMLLPCATENQRIRWSKLPHPDIPVAFFHHGGVESWVDQGSSWFNGGEINVVVHLIKSLLAEQPRLHQNEIAVITPWREQVWRMRVKLREENLGMVDVGNVEAYQGAEFKVTILSTVRSQERFLAEDIKNAQGFFKQRRRMNVATSRAKELLVVVGNAELLQHDPDWNAFLQIAVRCELYRGPKLQHVDPRGGTVPIIEKLLRIQNLINPMADFPEYEYLAASMATDVLHEIEPPARFSTTSLSSASTNSTSSSSGSSNHTPPTPTKPTPPVTSFREVASALPTSSKRKSYVPLFQYQMAPSWNNSRSLPAHQPARKS